MMDITITPHLPQTSLRGKTYPMLLYSSTTYTVYWAVFIDYNHDFDFNDANELVAVGNSSTTGAYTRYIHIPSNALTGKTGDACRGQR
jgi:hypothetical protein